MPEIQTNTPIPTMSDLLSAYTIPTTTENNAVQKGFIVEGEPKISDSNSVKEIWKMPKCETPFEKKMYILNEGIRVFTLILNTSVKLARIGAWFIAVCGGLFVALLATNTINQASEIFKKNILSKGGQSINTTTEISTKTEEVAPVGLESNTITPSTADTPEMIAKKRAEILEARKTARLEQERLKAVEQELTQ